MGGRCACEAIGKLTKVRRAAGMASQAHRVCVKSGSSFGDIEGDSARSKIEKETGIVSVSPLYLQNTV